MEDKGVTATKVRELGLLGKSAREIADALKISRQRVYQIAKSYGISLKSGSPGPNKKNTPMPPRSRVQTGGVQAAINQSVAGSICELLVAADLMTRGWQVYMPVLASRGHDLIGVKDGKISTFEVRSAYRNSAGRLIFGKKPDCISEIYALVVSGEPVNYDPPFEKQF